MKTLIVLGTAVCCGTAAADTPEFSYSGFGTLGAVVTNTDDAQYRANLRQDRGATKSLDPGVDSRIGLQGNVRLNHTFSAVGQVLALRRDEGFRANVEWLYGQASVVDGLDLRAGRMVLPIFLISDSRSVGYSAHWVRAPRDVYDWYPATYFDGGQALYRFTGLGVNFQLQGSLGKSKSDTFLDGFPKLKFDFRKLSAISLTAESGSFTFRLGQTVARDLQLTGSGLPAPILSGVRDAFTAAGAQYDDGRWLVMSEYIRRRDSKGGFGNTNAYYVSGGYHLASWMPYLTYSHDTPRGAAGGPKASTKSAGVRWDAFKNVALKAQLDVVSPSSSLVNEKPAFLAHPDRVNALSVTADFVF